MTTTEDPPVDRDAWRRLLARDGEAPPELTDARIRARARQALTPRAGRWWLPASLAASLLLAVVLVQRQYERTAAPAVTSESDYSAAPVEEQAALPQVEATPGELPPPAAPAPQPRLETDRAGAAPPAVPPPMIELPQASEARATSAAPAESLAAESPPAAAAAESKREDEKAEEIVVTGNRRRVDGQESDTPVTQATADDVTTQGVSHAGGLLKSGVAERTPEAWYAEIEKLRAAGRKREATRELELLRKVHPGWLEKNHPTDR